MTPLNYHPRTYHEIPTYPKGATAIQIVERQVPQPIADFTKHLIDRWGMVAGVTDGEDSAGRSKLRLLTPPEIVARAVETAQLTYEAFAQRDWLLNLPAPKVGELEKSPNAATAIAAGNPPVTAWVDGT